MRPASSSLLLAGLPVVLTLLLAGCVPTTTSNAPGVTRGMAPVEAAEVAYVARMDGMIALPAIPLEKFPEPLRRQEVVYATDKPPGSIIIHPGQKFLYFVTGPNKAIRYGISVGKSGFEWAGEAVVSQTKKWPTWTPPEEMIARKPELEKWKDGQPGGPTNPLGARAIYLLSDGRDYGYRIHGTPEWWSIGKNASSGCIRMVQQDVIDLNQRVKPGAAVLVLNADGSMPRTLRIPTPPKPKQSVITAKPTSELPPMPEIKSVGYQPQAAAAPSVAAPAAVVPTAPATPLIVAPAAPVQVTP